MVTKVEERQSAGQPEGLMLFGDLSWVLESGTPLDRGDDLDHGPAVRHSLR